MESRINIEHVQQFKDALADTILETGEKLGFSEPGFDQGIAIKTSIAALGVTFIAGCEAFGVNPLTIMLKLLTAFNLKEGGSDE